MLYDAQTVNLRLLPRLHLQMRNLEAQNERIAGYLVSGDASRLSSPAPPHPRQLRSGYRVPSEIGCALRMSWQLWHLLFVISRCTRTGQAQHSR